MEPVVKFIETPDEDAYRALIGAGYEPFGINEMSTGRTYIVVNSDELQIPGWARNRCILTNKVSFDNLVRTDGGENNGNT